MSIEELVEKEELKEINKKEKKELILKGYHINAKNTYFKLLEDVYFSKRDDWIKVNSLSSPIGNDLKSTINMCKENSHSSDDISKVPLLFTNLSIESNDKQSIIRIPYFNDKSTSTPTNNKPRIINYNSIIRNAIPNYQIMTDKYLLCKALLNNNSKYQVPTLFINRGKIEIKSPLLNEKDEVEDTTIWFLKDPLLNKSNGIYLFNSMNDAIKYSNLIENQSNRFLLQKEIQPKLLNGLYKFDIRVFLVLTFSSDANVQVYIYNQAIVRSTNSIYKKGNLNKDSQLTNFCYQSQINPNFNNILPLSEYEQQLQDGNGDGNSDKNRIFNLLKDATFDIFSKIFINKLNSNLASDGFSLLGLDFILDENDNPFLLEINISPSTFQNSPPNVSIICKNLLKELPSITFDKILNEINEPSIEVESSSTSNFILLLSKFKNNDKNESESVNQDENDIELF